MGIRRYDLEKTKALGEGFDCVICEKPVNEGESFYTSPRERGLDYIDCYCMDCAENINYEV